MPFDKRLYRNFDKTLLLAAILIALIGLMAVHSATLGRGLHYDDSFVFRQINWMALGALLMLCIISVSYQRFIDMAYVLYAANIAFLVLVLLLGEARLGAQRWFSIGGFTFQPSEFIKVSLVLVLTSYIGSKKDSMASIESIIVPALLLAVPFILVLLQPDLGTALLLIPIFFSMLLVGGARVKHIMVMILLGAGATPFFWHFLREYQKQRLMVFINPNIDPLGAGYTIIQSKIAVGSGGLFGKGWLSGTQNQLNFLPERHTDFIFSVIGEEWGFLGALTLILLYVLIVKRSFGVLSYTSDMYGKLIATGLTVLLALQVITNIGMTIGLMPVVGVPLPMVSYGGSSLIATAFAIGLILSVGMRRSTF